ncbi:MAG: NAD-dependent epimerase/dehydratase family protein [Acidimicrobiia bacterium]|nr:NAD-dependent epimerase/dehydratase family protein [Acidimicrobiia bacterium]
MTTVVITGAAGRVGRRLMRRLEDHDLVAVDQRARGGVDRVDLMADDLKPLLYGADVVVHLASSFDGEREASESAQVDFEATTRLLDAAGTVGVPRFVMLSSAMAYGAWPNNPVPLTESAPLRPNPEFSFAVVKAELERLAVEWQEANAGSELVILRPTTAVAPGGASWVARAVREASLVGVDGEVPPMQFLHLDDLVEAIALAVEDRLSGVYNVAPDSWVDLDVVRSLEGAPPRLQVSEEAAGRFASFRWRYRLAQTPPGIVPYTVHPWVIANDRLKAAGWQPESTNEQTVVEGYPARPWAMMSSKQRQKLALAGAAVLTLGAVAVAALLVRRFRRR